MDARLAGPIPTSFRALARAGGLAALCAAAPVAQQREPVQPATPGGVIATLQSTPLQKLVAPDGIAGDMFGAAVSLHGSTVLAGAPNHPATKTAGASSFSGAAYVFVRDSSGLWEPLYKLSAPAGDDNAFDAYGSALAIGDGLIAIGAPQDDGSVPRSNRGAVYVYAQQQGAWNLEAKLLPPVGDPATSFGQAVALWDSALAIGASSTNTDGKVYVFRRQGSSRAIESTLAPSGAPLFGWSVAMHQDKLAVGAPGAASGGIPQSGRAYVYERGPAGWSLLQELTNPTPNLFDQFGWSVAAHGRMVAAGTPFDAINGVTATGATYVFAKSDGAYAPLQTVTSNPSPSHQHFGNAVAMASGRLLIGAELAHVEQGRAFRFSQLNPQSWTQIAQYKDGDAADQPWFGCAVAVGDFAVVGARRDDEVALDAGAAFVFGL